MGTMVVGLVFLATVSVRAVILAPNEGALFEFHYPVEFTTTAGPQTEEVRGRLLFLQTPTMQASAVTSFDEDYDFEFRAIQAEIFQNGQFSVLPQPDRFSIQLSLYVWNAQPQSPTLIWNGLLPFGFSELAAPNELFGSFYVEDTYRNGVPSAFDAAGVTAAFALDDQFDFQGGFDRFGPALSGVTDSNFLFDSLEIDGVEQQIFFDEMFELQFLGLVPEPSVFGLLVTSGLFVWGRRRGER
ncbi:MAG: PEP-CTERM sorting domain-containing protein [Verrucomicrobiota bacterium]